MHTISKTVIVLLTAGYSLALHGNTGGPAVVQQYYYTLLEVNIDESAGHNRHPWIDIFNQHSGVPLGSAWCAAMVCFVLDYCGYPTPYGCAWSPSWFPASKVIDIQQVDTADVFGLYYSNLGRIGHVGFVDGTDRKDYNPRGEVEWIYTVEGNTSPWAAVDASNREGDGMYRKRRHVRTISKVSRWISLEN